MRPLLAIGLLLLPAQEKAAVAGKVTVAAGAKPKIVVLKYTGSDAKLLTPAPTAAPIVWLEGGATFPPVQEAMAEVRQEGLQYRPRSLAVRTGTTVRFTCIDPTLHNVFALRSPTRFDLGKHGAGAQPAQQFPAKGLVHVRCKMHDHMAAFIHVFDHPYFAVAREDGSYSIPDVPPGRYALVAWLEGFETVRREVEVKPGGPAIDLEFARLEGAPAERSLAAGCCAPR